MSFSPVIRFCLPLVWFASILHAAPPELVQLQQQYQQSVTAPHETAKGALDAKFVTALGSAAQTAKQSGNLDAFLAIQQDQKRLTDKLPIPDDDEQTPESLKKLRAIYRDQLAKLEAQRVASHTALLPAYIAKLRQLEATLTKADRIAEALEVKTHREGMAQGGPVEAPGAPGTPMTAKASTKEEPPSAPVVSSVPKVKGDDRKAAEWVLANWSEHRLWITNGRDVLVKGPADLPKGKFEITSISIDGRYFTGTALDGAALLQNLGGLGRVQTLTLGSFESLKDEDLAFIATLPALQSLSLIKVSQLTDAVLLHVHGLRSLKKIELSEVPGITGATLNRWVDSPVEDMKIWKCGITDASISNLAAFRKLQSLNVSAHKGVTDASLPHLRSLPALSRLYISATGITTAGLAATPMPRIESLDCHGLLGLSLKDIIPQVAPAFPNLRSYQLSYETRTPEDLAALVHFKKLEHIANYGVVDEAAWPGLLELRSLISFGHNSKTKPLPDVALQTFAQLKKLKTLGLGDARPTEAGLAALRKARPDLKINE